MVDHPAEYPWSSYRINAQGEPSDLVRPQLAYEMLGDKPESRQTGYRELFHHHLKSDLVDQIRNATNGNFALGSKHFSRQIEQALGRRVSPGKSGRPSNKKS